MAALLGIIFALLLHLTSGGSSSAGVTPYRLGSFASPTTPSSCGCRSPLSRRKSSIDRLSAWWNDRDGARLFRLCVFLYNVRGSVGSILDDSWEAVRDPERVFRQQIRHEGERDVVMRRTRRSETIRKLMGAGYTPRLVWLFGLMLRGIIHCTALPTIFEPPLGFGAGAVLAARFAHREWLPCIMLGWYGSGFYWRSLFGVDGPPYDGQFDGVPIKIRVH